MPPAGIGLSHRKPYIHRGSGCISRCATKTDPSMPSVCKWPSTQHSTFRQQLSTETSHSKPSRSVPSYALLSRTSPASDRLQAGDGYTSSLWPNVHAAHQPQLPTTLRDSTLVSHILDDFDGAAEKATSSSAAALTTCQSAQRIHPALDCSRSFDGETQQCTLPTLKSPSSFKDDSPGVTSIKVALVNARSIANIGVDSPPVFVKINLVPTTKKIELNYYGLLHGSSRCHGILRSLAWASELYYTIHRCKV